MEFTPDRTLPLRMAVTLTAFGLFVCVTLAVTGLIGVVGAIAVDAPPAAGALVGVGVPLAAAAVETRDGVGVPTDAHPVPDDDSLQQTVDRLARGADLPRPRVYQRDDETPVAFVVGTRPRSTRLVVSTGLIDALDAEQLEAVLAHEIAHVANRDAAVVTLAYLPIAAAGRLLTWADADDPEDVNLGIVFALPVWLAAASAGRVLIALVGRTRQYAADRGAVALAGSPAALATALGTVASELDERPPSGRVQSRRLTLSVVDRPVMDPEPVALGPEGERTAEHVYESRKRRAWLARKLSTHPPVERRIERLQAMERELETASA